LPGPTEPATRRIRFIEVPQSSQYQLDKWLTDRLQEEIPAKLQGYAALP